MTKIIVFTNSNGWVSKTFMCPGFDINEECNKFIAQGYSDAIVVDDSTLPNSDSDYFEAWRLSGSTVSINFGAAQELAVKRVSSKAIQESNLRSQYESIGKTPSISDSAFKTASQNCFSSISSAATISDLRAAESAFQSVLIYTNGG